MNIMAKLNYLKERERVTGLQGQRERNEVFTYGSKKKDVGEEE